MNNVQLLKTIGKTGSQNNSGASDTETVFHPRFSDNENILV